MLCIRFVFAALLAAALISAAHAADDEFVVKTSVLSRTVSDSAGFLKTTRLEAGGTQMLAEPSIEFMLDVDFRNEPLRLVPSDFETRKASSEKLNTETRYSFELRCKRPDLPLQVYVRYAADSTLPYMQKWITFSPCKEARGAILRRVILEDCRLKPDYQPVTPVDRFAGKGGEDSQVDLSNTAARFRFDTHADFAAIDPKANRGIYFFVGSLHGQQVFTTSQRLVMLESMYVPVENGYQTGKAIIGTAAGPPEVLYKRFREFLWDRWCIVRGKRMLAGREMAAELSEQACLEAMRAVIADGRGGLFRLDRGWESHHPLTEDPERFPQGLPYLAAQAKSMDMVLAYRIGSLTSGGQWDGLMKDHPDWFAPATDGSAEGAAAPSLTTPYAGYVEDKLLRLVNECGAAMLCMDGSDWSDFRSPPEGPYHVETERLRFVVLDAYKSTIDKLRKANKDLVISLSPDAGSSPAAQVHRLGTIDQASAGRAVGRDALSDRQRRYAQAFIFPPYSISRDPHPRGHALPFPQAKMAAIGAISDLPQVQGPSRDPEFGAYLERFLEFRGKFESFFEVYQHVLGFPDGKSIDGQAHIVNGSGFIILFNPTSEPKKTILPLDEPGLELKGSLKLSDWTEFGSPTDIAAAQITDRVEVELAPESARIIGVNIVPAK